MRIISNREFVANPEMYFGLAREQDVRIRKGRQVFRLVHESQGYGVNVVIEKVTEDTVKGVAADMFDLTGKRLVE